MPEDRIENLQEVLREQIGNNTQITNIKIERLTAPGENYGSTMLKLDLTLVNKTNNSQEQIHAVAKQLPVSETKRKIFNVQATYKNEIAMYATIMPTLQEFQREHGMQDVIDCYPKLYGARINLDGKSDLVDEDAVIILENLVVSGYSVVNRYQGFDLETTQLILKDLAAFHAVPLALKLQKPEVFAKKVKPYLTPFNPPPMPKNQETKESIETVLVDVLRESSKCGPYIEKIEDLFERLREKSPKSVREPFATLTHGDIWVNNTMVKFKNGKPVQNKLVDFQVCDYKSPASDLIFFLLSSVKASVLEEHFDELIKLYHRYFVSHLEKLECDIRPFSYENCLEELRLEAPSELPHTLFMTVFVILGKKGGLSVDAHLQEPVNFDKIRKDIRQDAKEKAHFIVQFCGNKGWL